MKLRNLHPNVRATARTLLRAGNKAGIAKLVDDDSTDRDLRGIKDRQAQAYLMACEDLKAEPAPKDVVLFRVGVSATTALELVRTWNGHLRAVDLEVDADGTEVIRDVTTLEFNLPAKHTDAPPERVSAFWHGWLMAAAAIYTDQGPWIADISKFVGACLDAKTPQTAEQFCDLILRRKAMYGKYGKTAL